MTFRALLMATTLGALAWSGPVHAQEESPPDPGSPPPLPGEQPAPPPVDSADSAAEARKLLRKAIDLYASGRYAEAAARLRPLVEERVLADQADQKEALRAYGVSLYLSGARAGAERAFRALLRMDVEERLDPNFVRPEVVAYFERLRSQYQAELAGEVRRRTPRYLVANLLPPWGQFQNRHRVKGYLVLSGELLFAAGSITTAALLYSWRDKQGRFPGHEEDYTAVSAVNYATFAALAAVIVYGVVDGLYYYYRDRPDSRDEQVAAQPALIRF